VFSSPAIGSDGTIYVGSCDNKLYAIKPDGTLKWSFPTGYWVFSSPAIGSDGTIYVGSYDGKLYAIYGSGTLANTPWPKFHHDLKNTGRVGGP
jgi:outer membrane protein assembly factor BamB